MDFFTEYIIKQKKSPFVYIAAVGMVIATLLVWMLTFPFLGVAAISGLVGLVDVGMVYLSYIVITNFNIEYEYIVTNTDLDVDKIINRRKRKRVISVRFSDMELMAPVGYPDFRAEENGTFAKVHMAAKSADDPEAYYIITDTNGTRVKLIFNPTQKMVDNAKRIAPRKVYTKGM